MSAVGNMNPTRVSANGNRRWVQRHRWLIARRASQLAILAIFLAGPLAGVWVVRGNLSSSETLGVLPLTDPFLLLQVLASGHWPEMTAVIGVLIVLGFYLLVGGRSFCAWVCPVNMVTDAAHVARERLGLPKGWQPDRRTRLWVLGMTLAVSALTGTLAWELVNPVSMLHRGLIFGFGLAWVFVAAVFIFDLLVSRRGWCGHLCPMGAAYGLIGKVSLARLNAVRREVCDDCMDCFNVCPEPQVISPALRGAAGEPSVILAGDCTNCGRCADVCDLNVFELSTRFAVPAPARKRNPVSTSRKEAA